MQKGQPCTNIIRNEHLCQLTRISEDIVIVKLTFEHSFLLPFVEVAEDVSL